MVRYSLALGLLRSPWCIPMGQVACDLVRDVLIDEAVGKDTGFPLSKKDLKGWRRSSSAQLQVQPLCFFTS